MQSRRNAEDTIVTAASQRFVDWLAVELFRRGTRFAFGVPGGGVSLDLLAAAQGAGIRTVVTAREDAAAMMGGVAGRLANAPGLAFSTKGPGLASATNGLAQMWPSVSWTQCSSPVFASRQYTKPEKSAAKTMPSATASVDMLRLILS